MRIAPVNEKRKRITEQVDEVDGDPAKEEDDPDAPEEFFCSGHSKSLLVKKTMIKMAFNRTTGRSVNL